MRGGVFVSCRDFPGMSFSCGTQLSTDCEREGPTAPWVGSLSPIEEGAGREEAKNQLERGCDADFATCSAV